MEFNSPPAATAASAALHSPYIFINFGKAERRLTARIDERKGGATAVAPSFFILTQKTTKKALTNRQLYVIIYL